MRGRGKRDGGGERGTARKGIVKHTHSIDKEREREKEIKREYREGTRKRERVTHTQ